MYKWDKVESHNFGNRKKSNIRIKRLLLSLGFLCIIALMSMTYGHFFTIETIIVKGNEKISAEEIISSVNYYLDKNLLQVKSEEVKYAIKESIPIEDVTVKYKLPHTLILEVKEREISFAFYYLNGFVLIDSQGYVVDIMPKLERYAIPIITGFEIVDAQIAQKLVLQQKDEYFEDLLGLVDSLGLFSQELSEINFVIDENNEPAYYLYTLDGYQIFLGKFNTEKVEVLDELLNDIRKKGIEKGLLDISHNSPVFKPFNVEQGEGKGKL